MFDYLWYSEIQNISYKYLKSNHKVFLERKSKGFISTIKYRIRQLVMRAVEVFYLAANWISYNSPVFHQLPVFYKVYIKSRNVFTVSIVDIFETINAWLLFLTLTFTFTYQLWLNKLLTEPNLIYSAVLV